MKKKVMMTIGILVMTSICLAHSGAGVPRRSAYVRNHRHNNYQHRHHHYYHNVGLNLAAGIISLVGLGFNVLDRGLRVVNPVTVPTGQVVYTPNVVVPQQVYPQRTVVLPERQQTVIVKSPSVSQTQIQKVIIINNNQQTKIITK